MREVLLCHPGPDDGPALGRPPKVLGRLSDPEDHLTLGVRDRFDALGEGGQLGALERGEGGRRPEDLPTPPKLAPRCARRGAHGRHGTWEVACATPPPCRETPDRC